MKKNKMDVTRQVYLIFAVVLFIFANVFIFDNKVGIGYSVFSSLTLLTIGLLSGRPVLRALGVVSYSINLVVAIFGFNYLGWLTAVQAIELIFIVWYLYPKDSFLKTDSTDKFTYRFRWQQFLVIAAISFGIYVVYSSASSLWNGSFLEFGGNTALIFGTQYFLYTSLAKSRASEADFVRNLEQSHRAMEEIKAKSVVNPLYPIKKPVLPSLATDNFVKMAAIWLVVMDLSILSYLIKPNDIGFGIGAFFVLLSIVISLFVKTVENKNDVFSVIYHKIRPVQPVFFIILLIANAHKFSYGAAYALLFAAVYFVWAINKINMKTLLTITILIYFFPVFGYISNPFRLGAKNTPQVFKMITDKGKVDYFNLSFWVGLEPYNWYDNANSDDYSNSYKQDVLEERIREFDEKVTITKDSNDILTGIWNGEDYDLSISYQSDNSISIQAMETDDKLVIKDLSNQYASMKDLSPLDEEGRRYHDYYLIGQVRSTYGTYDIYIEMDEKWIKAYEDEPSNMQYSILVLGSDVELEDVNSINI